MVEKEDVFPFLNYTNSIYSKKYSLYKQSEIKENEIYINFKDKIKLLNISNNYWNKMANNHNKLVSECITLIFHYKNDVENIFDELIKERMKFNLISKLNEINKKIEENMIKFNKIEKKEKKIEKENQKNEELNLNSFLYYFSNEKNFIESFKTIEDENTKNYLKQNTFLNLENENKDLKRIWNNTFKINNIKDESNFELFMKEILLSCSQGSINKIKNSIIQIRRKYSKSPTVYDKMKSICNVEYNIYELNYLDFDIVVDEIFGNEEFLNKLIKISKFCPNWNIKCKSLKWERLTSLYKIDDVIQQSKLDRKTRLYREIEIGLKM
eukprot:gene12382-6049_t